MTRHHLREKSIFVPGIFLLRKHVSTTPSSYDPRHTHSLTRSLRFIHNVLVVLITTHTPNIKRKWRKKSFYGCRASICDTYVLRIMHVKNRCKRFGSQFFLFREFFMLYVCWHQDTLFYLCMLSRYF